ncbi:MAG: hypothetical protein IJA60_03485 [Clostridia bacterium]|nr:hypothetical protein [Clostridia bacterium]
MLKKETPIFASYNEKTNNAHFEFQYFRFSLCHEDSLFVPFSNDVAFFKEYLKYLEPTETPNGEKRFDGCGRNYYTKEQAKTMFERIKTDNPKEYTVLLKWLEKAILDSDCKGFYILGV